MNQQTDKTTALYYRVANSRTDGVYLDNQMQTLLCYAKEQGLDNFALYADIGKNGVTLDRPAFNALKSDIEAGRVGKVVVRDIARIARNSILVWDFIVWARERGAEIASIMGDAFSVSLFADMTALCRSLLKGGGQA
jgi:DNA invertase Pin-like site-specific DNA recombinase